MQITLDSLRKTYRTAEGGSIEAVSGTSLEIPENTVFGIIGRSGAGKSSLVRLISLLEPPDEGAVYYGGCRVDNLSRRELVCERRKIGMIFQNFNLFSSRTAGRNVAYPLEIAGMERGAIRSRVAEMLALVGLADRADAPISTLSGGQKQRVAIARALAPRPGILFCDEATSALDPQTTRSILDLIREIQAKMNLTVVMITHQMEVVRDACEHVAVIDRGAVVEQGLVRDIFARPRSAVTKDFLLHLAADGREELRWSAEGGAYTLRFTGDSPNRPVLSQLSRHAEVSFNIRAAGIQHLPGQDVGTMVADLSGSPGELQKAVAYLQDAGVTVEENT